MEGESRLKNFRREIRDSLMLCPSELTEGEGRK